MLWGTDQYFMDASQQLGRVVFAQIPEVDKRRILGENAARVLGIKVARPALSATAGTAEAISA